ncbi:MAG TPA: hypothetical protein VNR11_17600 [Xanthobacteraceae bacterium]|nr:hypothetical protein [Xanthobacteraceae bacterium]
MRSLRALLIWLGGAVAAISMPAGHASAAGLEVHDLRLSCENGRTYLIRPRGVTVLGELVTGYLVMSGPRRGTYIRLIPMGDGYRYAGPGIWLDGKRQVAELQLSKYRSVPCTVSTV